MRKWSADHQRRNTDQIPRPSAIQIDTRPVRALHCKAARLPTARMLRPRSQLIRLADPSRKAQPTATPTSGCRDSLVHRDKETAQHRPSRLQALAPSDSQRSSQSPIPSVYTPIRRTQSAAAGSRAARRKCPNPLVLPSSRAAGSGNLHASRENLPWQSDQLAAKDEAQRAARRLTPLRRRGCR